jgi:hypothetical protein
VIPVSSLLLLLPPIILRGWGKKLASGKKKNVFACARLLPNLTKRLIGFLGQERRCTRCRRLLFYCFALWDIVVFQGKTKIRAKCYARSISRHNNEQYLLFYFWFWKRKKGKCFMVFFLRVT